jgi:hypothetical protein
MTMNYVIVASQKPGVETRNTKIAITNATMRSAMSGANGVGSRLPKGPGSGWRGR